ncbi:hypothetical protein AB6A40_003816 [Gnathostoma spinigerum]|uniref:START domain-containing protein n=1 Tax=Gnathostoma spinigerum TaxID=75299 RepID=A0ABD6EKK6_9BILA
MEDEAIDLADEAGADECEEITKGYDSAAKAAEDVMELMMQIYGDGTLDSLEGWKKRHEKGTDVVYSKKYPIGKVFFLRTSLPYSKPDVLFNDHWLDIEGSKQWNHEIDYVEKVGTHSPTCDFIKYCLKDVLVVKGREFLVCRVYKKVDADFFVAAKSFAVDDIPRTKGKIRGDLKLGGGRFAPHPTDPSQTLVDYLFCVDFKLKAAPDRLIEEAIGVMMLKDAKMARKHTEQMKAEGKWT